MTSSWFSSPSKGPTILSDIWDRYLDYHGLLPLCYLTFLSHNHLALPLLKISLKSGPREFTKAPLQSSYPQFNPTKGPSNYVTPLETSLTALLIYQSTNLTALSPCLGLSTFWLPQIFLLPLSHHFLTENLCFMETWKPALSQTSIHMANLYCRILSMRLMSLKPLPLCFTYRMYSVSMC